MRKFRRRAIPIRGMRGSLRGVPGAHAGVMGGAIGMGVLAALLRLFFALWPITFPAAIAYFVFYDTISLVAAFVFVWPVLKWVLIAASTLFAIPVTMYYFHRIFL